VLILVLKGRRLMVVPRHLQNPPQSDCRRSQTSDRKGDYFSWCAVVRYADSLCPPTGGWRVPTAEDFCELDQALLSGKCNDRTEPLSVVKKYAETCSNTCWGGTYGGYCMPMPTTVSNDPVRFEGYSGYYWSQTPDDEEMGAIALGFGRYTISIPIIRGGCSGKDCPCKNCPPKDKEEEKETEKIEVIPPLPPFYIQKYYRTWPIINENGKRQMVSWDEDMEEAVQAYLRGETKTIEIPQDHPYWTEGEWHRGSPKNDNSYTFMTVIGTNAEIRSQLNDQNEFIYIDYKGLSSDIDPGSGAPNPTTSTPTGGGGPPDGIGSSGGTVNSPTINGGPIGLARSSNSSTDRGFISPHTVSSKGMGFMLRCVRDK